LKPYIYIMAMDSVKGSVLEQMINELAILFPFDLKIIHNVEYPIYAFEPKRNQFYANKILAKLCAMVPDDAEKLLGVTEVDLCTPVLSFIFGGAQLDGKVAIVSAHRLKQKFYNLPDDDELLFARLVKESVHELGHSFGLIHCCDFNCAMFFSNSVLSIDVKDKILCKNCREYFDLKIRKESYEHG